MTFPKGAALKDLSGLSKSIADVSLMPIGELLDWM
jgi:hypothetical protein